MRTAVKLEFLVHAGEDTIALADEKLNIIHLPELSMDNAVSLFTDRGVYVLLTVQSKSVHCGVVQSTIGA